MIVRPSGPTNSPLLAFIGEAPGEFEERLGQPFVGPSGNLLNSMIQASGLTRSECYVSNVVNIRPPNNDFSVFYHDRKRKTPTQELCAHRQRLWAELNEVKPHVVIALGEEALKSLTQYTGITDYRGTMIETMSGIRVLPTYHPAYVLRMYSERSVVETDIKKALRQARSPNAPQTRFTVDPSFGCCIDFLSCHHPLVAFDIETIGSCTRCLGFAWSDVDAISIPLIWKGQSRWSEDEETLIVQKLNTLLLSSDTAKIVQNSPFDCTIIARELGLHIENITLDTMFAHHLLYPELPKGLDFLSSIYTDFPMYWGSDRFSSDHKNAVYNCYDCCATFIAGREIENELQRRGQQEFYGSTIHPAIFSLVRMSNRGILVDQTARATLKAESEKKLQEIESRLTTAVGRPFKPNSFKQVSELVYGQWHLPVVKSLKTKRPTTDDDALKSLAKRNPLYAPILHDILSYRELRVLINTFLEAQLTSTGRATTSYNLAGTVTGRISSSKSWDGIGGNLQNILRGDFRRLYIADPGKLLIKADLKQAEFIAFCWFARIERLIKQYAENPNFDVHRWIASLVFNCPESAVTKDQRTESKNCTYAGTYQVGPVKISRMYELDVKRAKFVLNRLQQVIPELNTYWRETADMITTTHTITNPLGRQRLFLGRLDDALFRSAYSHRCQSTVADIILRAVATLDSCGVELLLQIHDEIVCQCPESDLDATCRLVRSAMEIPFYVPQVEVPCIIPVEISIGRNWFDTRPWTEGSSRGVSTSEQPNGVLSNSS